MLIVPRRFGPGAGEPPLGVPDVPRRAAVAAFGGSAAWCSVCQRDLRQRGGNRVEAVVGGEPEEDSAPRPKEPGLVVFATRSATGVGSV
jgi:hypothetical protein